LPVPGVGVKLPSVITRRLGWMVVARSAVGRALPFLGFGMFVSASALFVSALVGCSAEQPIVIEEQAGEGNNPEPGDVAEPEPWVTEANAAPGYAAYAYPAGPYGEVQGATIQNLRFAGWAAPKAVNYDTTAVELLSLSDFYDPDGSKNIELLIISAVATWCGVCQTEYQDMQEAALYAGLRPRGVQMLGILFEDAEALPAAYADMNIWAEHFDVEFPFVLDPGFKTGVYFDRSATPMNMVVDAKTMQILLVMTGYYPTMYDEVEKILQQRGR
jgi:AhpC/TSA family